MKNASVTLGGHVGGGEQASEQQTASGAHVVHGPGNLLTDVAGVLVGNASDASLRSGVTVALFEEPATAAVDVRGGAPGTRETDLLALENLVEAIDAIVLAGGSAFGLEAAGGATSWLSAQGRGFRAGSARVPIVPAAILFDLTNGGAKDWGRVPPYRDLGEQASAAASRNFALGSSGAGFGARTGTFRGGLGSASAVDAESGITVGALTAVNAFGSATVGPGPHFWAAPFERGTEFGGLGLPFPMPDDALAHRSEAGMMESTTVAVVCTDAVLSKAQLKRLAIMVQDGLARALHPVHTPLDGDIVFAAATGRRTLPDPIVGLVRVGTLAAAALARSVARAVYLADSSTGLAGMPPAWRDHFGPAPGYSAASK